MCLHLYIRSRSRVPWHCGNVITIQLVDYCCVKYKSIKSIKSIFGEDVNKSFELNFWAHPLRQYSRLQTT